MLKLRDRALLAVTLKIGIHIATSKDKKASTAHHGMFGFPHRLDNGVAQPSAVRWSKTVTLSCLSNEAIQGKQRKVDLELLAFVSATRVESGFFPFLTDQNHKPKNQESCESMNQG